MKLVKACRAEHNLRHGSAVQLGTFDYYRRTEDERIQDKGEASHSIAVRIDERCQIPRDLFNRIGGVVFQPADGPIPLPAHAGCASHAAITSMRIRGQNDTHVEFDHLHLEVRRQIPDGWIFCMSMLPTDSHDILIEGYEDSWAIPMEMETKFGHVLAEAFLEQFRTEWLEPNFQRDAEANGGRLPFHVWVEGSPVNYGKREFDIIAPDPLEIEQALSRISNMAFIKPERYSAESEFRFLLRVISEVPGRAGEFRIYQPAVDHIRLNLKISPDDFV